MGSFSPLVQITVVIHVDVETAHALNRQISVGYSLLQ